MQIKRGEKVRLEYELKVAGKDGDIIESSRKSGPILYEHGAGKMLAGLEKRLEGMAIGDEMRGVIPAAEAFGTEEMLPTRELPRKEFPAGEKLEVDRVFQARDAQGQPVSFKIVGVGADKVKVRFLHPLAGKDIEFWVKVLMIDDPASRKRAAVAPPPPPADAVGAVDDDK
jgi:FKBP-type peptidyl-prolyl cis-trans isomerase 2